MPGSFINDVLDIFLAVFSVGFLPAYEGAYEEAARLCGEYGLGR